jgi:hypothetical protein
MKRNAHHCRAIATLAALALAGCATRVLVVDDAMELADGRTRFVAFAERELGVLQGPATAAAAARGDVLLLVPTLPWVAGDGED